MSLAAIVCGLQNLKQDQGGKQEKVSSKKKHGWWSNLPFWGDEDSAEAAGAEAKREAPSLALASLLLFGSDLNFYQRQLQAMWRC